jgi:lysozyme
MTAYVYSDPAGNKTVCVGHAYTDPNGKPLKAGAAYSDDVCSYLLGQDIAKAQGDVKSLVKVPLSSGEQVAYTRIERLRLSMCTYSIA